MAKQVINVGLATNDGTGDSLRIGAQKINENFTELYSSIAYQLPMASTSVRGGVVIDGLTLTINDGILGVTGAGIRKLNTGSVDLTLTADDTTGRLVASGPLIVLTGGDGDQNPNNNYTQLQWTSDLSNPDTSKSQYLWLDTNGISLQTNDPEVYSNVLHYGNDGILTFNDAGKVGPVQFSNGIDLYASNDMAWAQLNYDNRNFFWVKNNSANIDVLTTENYHWEFTDSGNTILPGGFTFPRNDGMYISGAETQIGEELRIGPVGLSGGALNKNRVIAWGNTGADNGVEDFAIELYSDHSGGGDPYFAQLIIGQNWNTTVGEYTARAKSYLQNGLSVDLGDIVMRTGSVVFKANNNGIVFSDGTILTSAESGPSLILNGDTTTLQNSIDQLTDQIGIQTNELESLNGQLDGYQSQYAYWQSQPDYLNQQTPNTQKFAMLSQLSGTIGYTQSQISMLESQISNLSGQLAFLQQGFENSQLEFYYNADTQELLIDNGANSTVKFPNGIVFGDSSIQASAAISIPALQELVASCDSFDDFKIAIAAL